MQVLREHYNNLLIAINGLDGIKAIEPIAHHETDNNDKFNNFVENLMVYLLHVDTEGNAQFFFHRPPETAIYYISCMVESCSRVDEVILTSLPLALITKLAIPLKFSISICLILM